MILNIVISWLLACDLIFYIRVRQMNNFYRKHDPAHIGLGLKDVIKALFCAIVTPLGIVTIIRDAIYNHRVKKIKKERRI